jgi:hypothetical protein
LKENGRKDKSYPLKHEGDTNTETGTEQPNTAKNKESMESKKRIKNTKKTKPKTVETTQYERDAILK